jgi:hypothetical protein
VKEHTSDSIVSKLKILYLLLLATSLFFINDIQIIVVIGLFQLALWFYSKLDLQGIIRGFSRLKWFFLLVIVSYLLIPPAESMADFQINLGFYHLNIYLSGMEHAALMLSRVAILITISLWVRLSMPAGQFIAAIRQFGVPETVAIVIDAGLSLTSDNSSKKDKPKGSGQGSGQGAGQGGGMGKGRKDHRNKITVLFSDLRQGKFGFLDDLLVTALKKSRDFLHERYPNMSEDVKHDTAIILAVVVAVMSLKLLQLLPGLPFAPGHKNLIVIPLLVMASMTTRGKLGGMAAGFSVGIVSFLMGYGKFGIFEILHFALPGLVADLLVPLLVGGSGFLLLTRLAILGALIGLTRFAANFMILILVGSPALAWAVFIPMLASQLLFGSLSCIVCIYIVKKYNNKELEIN